MSTLETWYPGDRIIACLLFVAAAVTIVSTVAILAALALQSRPALRHSLLLSALICCLLSPFIAAAVVKCRLVLFGLPLMSPDAASAAVEVARLAAETPNNSQATPSFARSGSRLRSTPLDNGASIEKSLKPRLESSAAVLTDRVSANDVSRDVAESRPQISRLRRLARAATLFWAAGTILVLAGIVRCCLLLRQLRASLRPVGDERVRELLDEVGRRMRIRRLPHVGLSAEVLTPLAVGWLRPVIVLPESSLPQITRDQLRDVLVHETAHIVRGDHLVVALQLAAKALFWPIASIHLLNRQLVCAREEVCDNFVLDERDPASYGETLLRLAQLAHGRPPLAASTGILHWRGSLETRIAGLFSSRRNRQKTGGLLTAGALFTLFAASTALICSTSLVASQDKSAATPGLPAAVPPPLLKADRPDLSHHGRPFNDILSERVVTGAQPEPVFIDIDAGRWMTPPADLLPPENRGKPVDDWIFPEPLKRWIQHSGIDLAVQTDGQSVALVGFDLRYGESFIGNWLSNTEEDIAKRVSPVRPGGGPWITLHERLLKAVLHQRIPYVTREGGLGTFSLAITSFRGPNTIQFQYELARGPHVPKLTGQPLFAAYEPQILGQLAVFLIVDAGEQKLFLRIPGGSNQIEIGTDQVIVRELSHPELRAARLLAGSLEIDAPAGRVTVNGRGKSATLRRIGKRVQIELGNRIAEADHLTLWMPEVTIEDRSLNWKAVNARVDGLRQRGEKLRKLREEKEAILAELASKQGYRLEPEEILRHIAPPYPPRRAAYWRLANPNEFGVPADREEPRLVASYRWDGKLHCEDFSMGSGGWPLITVCDAVHRIKSQQISGPPELLQTPLPGDWVYREAVPDEVFARQFEAILRQELQLPIHLEFREVKREVYVARGDYHFTPSDDKTGNLRGVQIYGRTKSPDAGGCHGRFAQFLNWVGCWIDVPIVSEVKAHPQQLLWRQHEPAGEGARPATAAERREAHDPALVLHNVEQQTGLHFTKETRPVKVLFVERKPL